MMRASVAALLLPACRCALYEASHLPRLDAALLACEDLDALGCQDRLREVAAQHPGEALPRFYLGLIAQTGLNDGNEATLQYEAAFALDDAHVDTLCNLGKARSDRAAAFRGDDPEGAARDDDEAMRLWFRALELEPSHRMARVNVALAFHGAGRFDEAVSHWDVVLASDPADAEALYNVAVSLQFLGHVQQSADAYAACLAARPGYVEARINLAATYHKHGSVRDAVAHYELALEALDASEKDGEDAAETAVMILNNLGTARTQLGNFSLAIAAHERALALSVDWGFEDAREQTLVNLLKARVPGNDWSDRERRIDELLANDARRLARGDGPALLPFDTLLLPVDGARRFRHAVAQSRLLDHYRDRLPFPAPAAPDGALRVGYLCFDFNEHPTAAMVEGLFRWHRRLRDAPGHPTTVTSAAISYGKDDGSDFRRQIETLADAFVQVAGAAHVDAVMEARNYGAHIAVDLQGHTLGTRMELCAMRVAPVQLAYLIFPGTSGADFLDGVVVDRIVVPPENAVNYREKLVYLPRSYQINDYERHVALPRLRATDAERQSHGLPPYPAVVFCNFNKNDKNDPASFGLWMNVLRRSPGSVLWMLAPSSQAAFADNAKNLAREAAARGVHPGRLVWAPRVPKSQHLARHASADLLLDTLVYGAHSTATDALRGGLPLLTARGAEFPQRVGLSIQAAVGAGQELLQVDELKAFEALAVRLTGAPRGRAALAALRRRLAEEGRFSPIFDARQFTADMERAYHLVHDAFLADGALRRHVVVLAEGDLKEAPHRPYLARLLPSGPDVVLPDPWGDESSVGVR